MLAVLGTGLATMALSLVHSLAVFYLLFCFARLNWAGPFELGLYGALNNWFVARRAIAASIATLAQTSGLVVLPLIAQYAIQAGSWRDGWVAVGATVLIVGFVPTFLLLVRTPEDVGLLPDRRPNAADVATAAPVEPRFSRAAAVRTPAFWLLSLYTMLVYPVQAGVSLHQAAHLIERGLSPTAAATVIAVFSAMTAVSSFGIGFLPRRWPVRYGLLAAALAMSGGAFALIAVDSQASASAAAGLFGLGVGGMLTLIPVAWADYFGSRDRSGAGSCSTTIGRGEKNFFFDRVPHNWCPIRTTECKMPDMIRDPLDTSAPSRMTSSGHDGPARLWRDGVSLAPPSRRVS